MDKFESKSVFLRPFEAGDRPALQAYLNHPELAGRRYLPWEIPEQPPLSEKQVEQIISEWSESKKSLHLAVVERQSGELIGHAECEWEGDAHCPSLSLVIAPPFQRRGYATQVLRILLRYLFEYTPAHTVTAWVNDWNQPALDFLTRCGFQPAGRMRRVGIHCGVYTDLVVLDLLRQEWLAGVGGQNGA
jgi:aminoglycoside 6'-N-acetyltransferase